MREVEPQRVVMISTHGYVAAHPELGRPDTGGQVVYVLEVSKCLARMGYAVDILTRQFEDQALVEPVQPGVRIIRFPCGGNAFIPKEVLCEYLPEWVKHAYDYCRQLPADSISFINSHYWDAGLAGMQLAEWLSVNHVHTPHSLGVWKRDSMPGDPRDKERKYNFRRRIHDERMVYHASQKLVATTPQQRDLLTGTEYRASADKVKLVPPGYDDSRFFPVSQVTREILKRELGLTGKIVFAVGRLARNKGYDLLIRAMAPVCQRIPNARLLLAIGGTADSLDERTQRQELEFLAAQLGLSDRVLLRDYVPNDELANYYRAADVFALSSRYEPFGMTAVEAMANGTPTVITTEGGLWEQMAWGAESLYANPNDPEAFGHTIHEILAYPEIAARLAEQGSRKARACFTWTAITQKLLQDVTEAENERTTLPRRAHFHMAQQQVS